MGGVEKYNINEVVKAAERKDKEIYLFGMPIKYATSTCVLGPYVKTWYLMGIPYKKLKMVNGVSIKTYFGLIRKKSRRK